MDTILRHNIRQRWLNALFEFAHIEYQRRLWIEADYLGYAGDSAEAFCQYFDDLDLNTGYDSFLRENIITLQELTIVEEFHKQLDSYISRPEKKSLSDKNILKDIEWINLTKLAKVNWDKLKIVIRDKEDLDYMTNLENEFLNNCTK